MDNGMELRVKDYCAFCPDFDADVDKVDITCIGGSYTKGINDYQMHPRRKVRKNIRKNTGGQNQ